MPSGDRAIRGQNSGATSHRVASAGRGYPVAVHRARDAEEGSGRPGRPLAVAAFAGQRRAREYRVDLVTHGCNPSTSLRAGGKIRSKDSYGNESAVRDTED